MLGFTYYTPTKVEFGKGAVEKVGALMKQFGGKGGPKMSKKMRRMMQQNPEMAEKLMGNVKGQNGQNPFGL